MGLFAWFIPPASLFLLVSIKKNTRNHPSVTEPSAYEKGPNSPDHRTSS